MEEYTLKLYSFSAAYFLAHLFNILRTSGAIYGVSGGMLMDTPGVLIFQKQVTLVTKFGDILLHFTKWQETQDQMRWLKMGGQTIWPSIGTASKVATVVCKTITGLVGGWVITDSFLWIFNIVKYCQTLLTCLLVGLSWDKQCGHSAGP